MYKMRTLYTKRLDDVNQEKYYFDFVGTSEKQLRIATRAEQRKAFAAMSEPERVAALADEHVRMGEVVEAANAHTELHTASTNALKTALHPTNVASGLAASLGTDMVMEHFVDPDHRIPEIPREAVEGAAAGVVTEGVGAALGTAATGAALGPVAAGGAVGSVVGAQTGKAIYKSMKDAGVDDAKKKKADKGVEKAANPVVPLHDDDEDGMDNAFWETLDSAGSPSVFMAAHFEDGASDSDEPDSVASAPVPQHRTHATSFAGEAHGKRSTSESQTWIPELCLVVARELSVFVPKGGPSLQLGQQDLQQWAATALGWQEPAQWLQQG
ncbi:hypothetical protein AB1Y20_004095 [Prymnesium parvum]|uniref:Glycine zipper domain-containing protein n=1 Tax=Prymnesium parvum TaxID=97485 RepID=A0AB34J8V0_PRYPA